MNLYRQESDRPRKSFTPKQIIAKLRQIEVLISQGHSVAGGCPGGWNLGAELLPLAYGVWRVTQARQLKALKRENQQLKRLVADLALDKVMLEEVARGNF